MGAVRPCGGNLRQKFFHRPKGNHHVKCLIVAMAMMALAITDSAVAASRSFEMNIQDTEITLVNNQKYHTFAFNGQVPAPLIYADEGDDITVVVNNLTAMNHTIHWHGLFQKNNWKMDGVPGVTQEAIKPGESFTYHFKAEPAGTLWYHCHVNTNEHVDLRGMWGPLIIRPKHPTALEKTVTKDFILMLSEWDSKWADKPGSGGLPTDQPDYFTINGKSYPEVQPIRIKEGDVVRIRLIGTGDKVHSIHIHGHDFLIAFKDGQPLKSPIVADTVLIGPGERYDLIFKADNPGRWMVHDHIESHTVNGNQPMGGIMTVIEYEGIPNDPWYELGDHKFVPNFYYEESLKKGPGFYNTDVFHGKVIE